MFSKGLFPPDGYVNYIKMICETFHLADQVTHQRHHRGICLLHTESKEFIISKQHACFISCAAHESRKVSRTSPARLSVCLQLQTGEKLKKIQQHPRLWGRSWCNYREVKRLLQTSFSSSSSSLKQFHRWEGGSCKVQLEMQENSFYLSFHKQIL